MREAWSSERLRKDLLLQLTKEYASHSTGHGLAREGHGVASMERSRLDTKLFESIL